MLRQEQLYFLLPLHVALLYTILIFVVKIRNLMFLFCTTIEAYIFLHILTCIFFNF